MYEAPTHGANFDVSANHESFAKEEALDSKDLKNKLPALVKFSQWKKIEVIEKQSRKLAPDRRTASDKFPGGPVVFVSSPDRLSGKLFSQPLPLRIDKLRFSVNSTEKYF